ncbi:hypothetical protein BH09PAT4_BH09PAT4_05290 [soil metagenome]
MGSTKEQLNAAQQQAVNITDGPVLVVAGAGTGKTRVIVERIIRLIEHGVNPKSILALTFTEKAAGEMQDRVADASGNLTLDTTIATFNGFGNDLLQAYGGEWGLGSLRLLGETGQLVFLREHFDELKLNYFAPVSNPDGQLKLLTDYVSLLKQQLVLPETYQAYAKELPSSTTEEQLDRRKHMELARFYQTYLSLCRTEQRIDYDDQLFLTIELLRARPNILAELQGRYQYILVDEFQDTNPMQSELVDLLAGTKQNVMVVGDDDQSIYGWRGATLANILDFKQRYNKAKEITLTENYRSTQAILDAAYYLIQHNNPERLEVMNGLDKRLHAQSNSGPTPTALHFATLDAELRWVAEDISERLRKGQDPSSIAVLARRNQGVQKMHQALELQGIEHAVAGLSNNLYEQSAVRQLIEALRAINDPLDDLALFHTLSGPFFSLPMSDLATLSAAARREHQHLAEIISTDETEMFSTALQTLADWRKLAQSKTIGDLAYHIITDCGWKQQLYTQAELDAETFTQVQALSKFFRTLKEFERISGVASLQSYMLNLPALEAAGSGFEDASLDISDTLVNVLSVHRAKGLEWDTVYIIDCSEGSFPMRNFGGGLKLPNDLKASQSAADDHLAEERRLMYVASTRAKSELILTHADTHGSGAKRKPSRFIQELLQTPSVQQTDDDAQTSLELFAPRKAETTIPLPNNMFDNELFSLSVSQIDTWLRCPQDFYYKYVLQMPLPPSPALEYGTLIHGIIEQLHRLRQEGQPLPSKSDIVDSAGAALPISGYLSADTRARAHEQAKQTIQAVYERFSTAPLPIEFERPFAVELPNARLKIIGRLDAVYQVGQGVEIRDFKTGTSVTTPEKAKSRATSSNQLALYALAWQLQHNEMPTLLTLDFVETGQLGSVKKQQKSLDTLVRKLEAMITDLRSGNYPPGTDHTFCSHPV